MCIRDRQHPDLSLSISHASQQVTGFLQSLEILVQQGQPICSCLLYTSPSPRDGLLSIRRAASDVYKRQATSGPITVYKSCIAASNGIFTILRNSCTTGATDLFISKYIEGSASNKAIEIANFTGISINLSGYTVAGYFNGNSSPNTFISLPNVELPNNQVWVVVPFNATAALLAYANQITGIGSVSYTHLRAHETDSYLVC